MARGCASVVTASHCVVCVSDVITYISVSECMHVTCVLEVCTHYGQVPATMGQYGLPPTALYWVSTQYWPYGLLLATSGLAAVHASHLCI